jgi:hypothetical protein
MSAKMERGHGGKILLASAAFILMAGAGYACSSDDELDSQLGTGGGSSSTSTSGGGNGAGTSDGGSGAGFDPDPEPEPCEGHAGEIICVEGAAITCDANGEEANAQDCGDEICVPGTGCILCIAGQFSCEGNSVLSCNPGPPPQWDTIATCDPMSYQKCNAVQGACLPLTIIGGNTPTGTYYQYARFLTGDTEYLGGYDVDSLGDYLYINRGGSQLDIYKVELLDSDGDGEFEPNQHPDNPDAIGPVEDRVITHIQTYDTHLGQQSVGELYAVPEGVFFIDSHATATYGDFFKFTYNGQTTAKVVDSPTPLILSHLGYDAVNGTWYGANEQGRRVFSFHAASNEWVAEFAYPDLAGSHMDGIEVVTDPNDGTPYVYVSDMTSDFLGQYLRDRGDTWVQVNLFEYAGTGDLVEGMGFGALNHFWCASGNSVYEIGGGDLAKFTEPDDPPPR